MSKSNYMGFSSHDEYNQYEKEMALIEREEREKQCGNIETTKLDDTSTLEPDGMISNSRLTGQKELFQMATAFCVSLAKAQEKIIAAQISRIAYPVKDKE